MPHFHTWQQSKTFAPGIALIDKTKKLLLYAEYYIANFFSTWNPDYNRDTSFRVVLRHIRCFQYFYLVGNGLDEILNLIVSVSEGFPTYSYK